MRTVFRTQWTLNGAARSPCPHGGVLPPLGAGSATDVSAVATVLTAQTMMLPEPAANAPPASVTFRKRRRHRAASEPRDEGKESACGPISCLSQCRHGADRNGRGVRGRVAHRRQLLENGGQARGKPVAMDHTAFERLVDVLIVSDRPRQLTERQQRPDGEIHAASVDIDCSLCGRRASESLTHDLGRVV